MPDVGAATAGATTVWLFDFTTNSGGGSATADLTLSRAPGQLKLDLVSLPGGPGRLLVQVAADSVSTTFNGKPVTATFTTKPYSGTTSIAFALTACAADLGASFDLAVTHLEVRDD